ncbi:MAG: ROK family protein [Bacteroidota bacterium]|nr:ROK family protein [Bacteroidota bacterium]
MNEKRILIRNKILKELYFNNNLSCADLTNRIQKSFPVTSNLIEELLAQKLVSEKGYAPSTGGRKPLTYSIHKDVMYLVSVAMDQYVTKIAIMDMQNDFVSPIEKIFLPLADNPKALETLQQKIIQLIDFSGIPKEKFVAVGIGMPGFVNVEKGINYSFLQLAGNESITSHLSKTIGLPVYIDNDSSLIALAEFYFGGAKNEKNAMVINIGWGIGLGMILNGELFRGHDGFAGEFSHIPLFLNGKLCWCGKVGCLETETSLLLMIKSAKEGIDSGRLSKLKSLPFDDLELAYEGIAKAVLEGDQFAAELFSKAGYNIGKGLAILIHLLNPRKIILSGRGALAGQIWLAPIQQALNENCIPRLYQGTSIEISTLGVHAELIGAAALVMEHYEEISTINKKLKEPENP